jgi:hypothetical protein
VEKLYLLKSKKEITIYNEEVDLLYIKELNDDSLKCVKCFGNFQHNYNEIFGKLSIEFKKDHMINEDKLINYMRRISNISILELFNKPIDDLKIIFNLLVYSSFRFDPVIINNPDFFETENGIIEPPIILFEKIFSKINMEKDNDGFISLISNEEDIKLLINKQFKEKYRFIFFK